MAPPFLNWQIHLPRPVNDETTLPPSITRNRKLYPFFYYALGAIDGTHVAAYPPSGAAKRFRDRHGNLSFNVLAACTWDMRFCYIASGWEGSASDSRVYDHARRFTLPVPDGYFYLGDAGFPLCDALLVPYRGVRYHLKEWGSANLRPRNAQELFNLRHAQLRNIIERTFGAAKRKFVIMGRGADFDIKTQAKFFPAFAAIFNFIHMYGTDDDFAEDSDDDVEQGDDPPEEGEEDDSAQLSIGVTETERNDTEKRRDLIASTMRESYQAWLAEQDAMDASD
ncbi:hypothetical protein PsYK624_156670 [Phanerochaete sordida]|uniref:DDE Tnp4 domain-containing protein n=1 Tax=Phanerochaete sordida TaxID=48140 RepID=A0A9P3GTH2_9APHY|nr:hypothetical protein PsYK624_156670 [Phanerochaete sordida]